MSGLPSLTGAGLRGRRRAGTLALVLVVALAALGIVTGLVVRDQGAPVVDRVADQAEVAHLVLYGDPAALSRIATSDPAVIAASGPFELADADLKVGGGTVSTQLTAMSSPDGAAGRPARLHGRWLDPNALQVVLETSLARDTGLHVGDTVHLRHGDRDVKATVVGTAIDLTDCSYPDCSARAYASPALLAALAPGDSSGELLIRLRQASDADAVLSRLLTSYPGQVTGSDSWLDTRADLLVRERVFGAFLTGFGLFLLLAACVVLAGSTVARMAARRREVGLLKAVGVAPAQVAGSLLVEHVLIGAVGVLVGWFFGCLLAAPLSIGVAQVFGGGGARFSVTDLAIALVGVTVILSLATLVPAARAARLPATDVLRDAPTGTNHGLCRLIDRIGLRPAAGLGLTDAVARPGRSALSAGALGVAVIGAVMSVGFVGAFRTAVDQPALTGDPWDVQVETVGQGAAAPTDAEVTAVLRSTPGVARSWSMIERRSTINGQAFRSRGLSGAIGDAGFELGGGRFPTRAGEAVVGYGFLTSYGAHVGETVDFDAGPTRLAVTITGWYRETEDSGRILMYPIATLQRAEPGASADEWQAVAAPGVSRTDLAARLDERLGPGARVEALSVDSEGLGPFKVAMGMVAALVGLVAAAQLLAAAMASGRERARDLGMLRAIGASSKGVLGQHAITGALLGVAAAAVGLPLGMVLYRFLSDAVTRGIGAGPGFAPLPSPTALVLIGVGAVALAAVVGILAVAGLVRRPASELVRWE